MKRPWSRGWDGIEFNYQRALRSPHIPLIVVDGNVEPFAKMVAVVFCLEILVNGGNITLGKYGTKESIDQMKSFTSNHG